MPQPFAVLGSTFRITGLSSPQEASELALMLRAGALAAPMYFVEERVVGPSLGQENIDKGVLSTQIGFLLVAIWMVVFFRLFGLIANFALVFNLAMILTIMSWIGASSPYRVLRVSSLPLVWPSTPTY